MSLILYPQENNKLAIVYPAAGVPLEEVVATAVPAETEYAVVDNMDSLDIVDGLFDAYEFAMGGAVFNAAKGKEIQRGRWRAARKPLFEALDVLALRALEAGSHGPYGAYGTYEEIVAAKQALRDVTLTPLPEDAAGIWATWPAILS